MCGVAGRICMIPHTIDSLSCTLHHRGPDDQGDYHDRVMGKEVYFHHDRLSIIDLSTAGHQPMVVDGGSGVLVYNGEIYNHRQLRARYLRNSGIVSNTDTEVLLHLLYRHDIECLTWLHGDFAFCYLNRNTGLVYLVRDRLGVKPLYYAYQHDSLVFGSELKIFPAYGTPLLENIEDLQAFMGFKYYPENRTPFAGIYRVPPGTYLRYEIFSGAISQHTYWDAAPRKSVSPYQDSVEQLRDLLRDAVVDRLMADVPVGTFLSGGLDSSTIAYFLREHPEVEHHCARKSSGDLRNEGTSSDADYAERLSQDWNLRTHYYDIGMDEANVELIASTLFYGDDLIADGSQIPSFLITKAAAGTSKVLLSGMGADELFLGYGGHILTLLSQYMDRLPRTVSRWIANHLSRLEAGKGLGKGYKRFLVKLGRYDAYGHNKYGLYSIVGDYERSLSVVKGGKDPLQYITPYFENVGDPFEALTRFELKNFLVKNLNYLDRMCMANSVEGRVPFMDHRLVEFALSLPVEYKLSPFGNSKCILKDAMKGLLPDYILNRRKAGFGMPLRSVFSDRRKLDGLLQIDYFGGMQNFNTDNIIALADEHIAGVNDNSSILYALVSYRIWRQRWIEN